MSVAPLAYLYGKPDASALLRQQADDFIVEEQLNFTPSGSGEHVLLYIEKTGQNTQFVAKQLAELTGLRARDISYAGLKDRHAVTRQWFCFKWPIKAELNTQHWVLPGCQILQIQRHYRKLRLGALKANHFQIRLRQVSEASSVLKRIEQVSQGVPNYYGEQRFGINGGNLELARQLFAGQSISDRKLRGLALSAARSFVFNQQVSARITAAMFNTVLNGDVLQLNGSGSVFRVPLAEAGLQQRLTDLDVHLTACLPGLGEPMVSADAAVFEQQVLAQHSELVQGLIDYRLSAERRAIRLLPQQLTSSVQGSDMVLSFALPPGCFATSVLRELVQYRDCSKTQDLE
ncbi:tRNA pseudouridine(13) synthase TruD [Rheinheimera nanhaiensis]|uniref:tRNA pseudouridine synthase D n=1 Tax=Rheinheimera nanhaiensis E407-8 TaxID=562729 RepID=I1E1A3_9GAMM|nr:tRNA pseudouridine(13) synthase TruD [Rheinheimera nanhaiensis]GAB60081.1 tRNA pseudouridine13 synthase [Rheinheimera nanhaiensis E407-8]